MLSRFSASGWQILASSGIAVSCPADVTEDILASVLIPGGSLGINGIIRATSVWTVNNNVNNKNLFLRLGGIGGTAYLVLTLTLSLRFYTQHLIMNRGSQNSQIGAANTGAIGVPEALPNATGVINTAVDQTLVFNGQKAVAGDTITLESYMVEVFQKN